MAELRSYMIIDNLQEQLAAYLGSNMQGYMPVAGMASLFIEVAPGMPQEHRLSSGSDRGTASTRWRTR